MIEITELEYATSKVEMLLVTNIVKYAEVYYTSYGRYGRTEFANDLRVTLDDVDRYLSGTHHFTLKELCNIAYVLEISIKDLFDFS